MNHRAELARLITDGGQRPEIYEYFLKHDFHPLEVDHFLHELGVYLPQDRRPDDGISEERRLFLQELSTQLD